MHQNNPDKFGGHNRAALDLGECCKVKNSVVQNNFCRNDKNSVLHHFPDLFIQGKSYVNTFYIQNLITSAPNSLGCVILHQMYCILVQEC